MLAYIDGKLMLQRLFQVYNPISVDGPKLQNGPRIHHIDFLFS